MKKWMSTIGVFAVAVAGGLCIGPAACSGSNREGPDVTCEDLLCGQINACENGIIAQCADGVTVRFHACSDKYACTGTWQTAGAFKCEATQTDCEGCRPERNGCDDLGTGGGGGSAAGGGGSAAGGGGSAAGGGGSAAGGGGSAAGGGGSAAGGAGGG